MATAPSQGIQPPPLSEGAQFAMDYMGTMAPGVPEEEATQVLSLIEGITDVDEALVVLHRLGDLAVGNGAVQEALERARALRVGSGSRVAEVVSDDEVVQRLETRGYVSEAPDITEQIADESRENVGFMYDGQTFRDVPAERGRNQRPMTERRGLNDLSSFLTGFLSKTVSHAKEAGFVTARAAAKSIKKNLTYIGRKERDKGTSDFATYFGEHLLGDEENQLCIITGSSLASITGERRETGLSDDVIRAEILDAMERRGVPASVLRRIITDPRQLSGDPAKWKVAFVDDWVVSGRQMRTKIKRALHYIPSEYHSAVEIDVLAAPPHFIDEGFAIDDGMSVPVKASYRAHAAAADASEGVRCHITGTDATVNFGFGVQIEYMQRLLNEIRGRDQPEIPLPALATVYRSYWDRLRRAGPRRR